MFKILTTSVAAMAWIACFSAYSAHAERPRLEVSADGHETVIPVAGETDGSCTTRGAGVPFPTTPDWNSPIGLRRQVGAVAAGDLNNDGRIDVAVGCYISNSFPPYTDWENFIFYNTGNALESSPSWISADERHTGDILIGDVNRDGFPDIVAVNGGTAFSPSVIYYGGPTGPDNVPDWFSSPAPSQPAYWSTAGALFDWDHDNDLDLILTSQGLSPTPTRPTYGFVNNSGALESVPSWVSADSSIQNGAAFGDYDGDGWEDLAIARWVNYQTGIMRNVGGVLQTTPIWSTGVTGGDRGVSWADVDGNGWRDLAVGRQPITLYSNNAGSLAQTWSSTAPGASNPQELRFFDVDRDGDDDLAEIIFSSGRVNIYLNENGVLTSAPAWSWDDPLVGNALAFGDINGDTWPDLIIGLSGEPCVRVFYARIPNIPGDMNCDGRVNAQDVEAFVLALLDPAAYAAAFPYCGIGRGDLNTDSSVNGDDIQPFVALVIGPT